MSLRTTFPRIMVALSATCTMILARYHRGELSREQG